MKPTKSEIQECIRNYVLDNFFDNDNQDEFDNLTKLISDGIMDSISAMQLVSYLEETYNIEFEASDVDKKNLDNISNLAAYVESKIA